MSKLSAALPMAGLLWAVLLLTTGCGRGSNEDNGGYRTVAAASRDIVIAVEAAGSIEPITTVEVKSKASGEILDLPVDTGDVVSANDLLVVIDQRIPRNAVAQANANLEVAQARLEHADAQLQRMQQLHTQSSVSNVDFERAQLDVANARAEVVRSEVALETARIQMEDTELRAPIGGTIIRRLAERGQVISSPAQDVSGGSVLLEMAELSTVRVRTLIDETDIGKIRAGIPARVTVAAYPDSSFEGHVLKVEPHAEVVQNVTMFPVLVDLDNRDGRLMPGMNATVNIDIARRHDVLAVPNAALRTAADASMAARLLNMPADTVPNLMAAARAQADDRGERPVDETETAMPDMAQLREIREKQQRGAALSEAEQKIVNDMRERMARGGGPGFGNGGQRGGSAAGQRRSNIDEQMGGQYVVFVDRGNGPAAVLIQAGITDLDYTEVVSGLDAGDRVFLLPSASLQRSQENFQERMNRMTGGIPGMSR